MVARRTVVKGALAAGATVVVPAVGLGGYVWTTSRHSNVGQVEYIRRLPIPPLADVRAIDGRWRFDLELQHGVTDLLPGKEAATWGINGPHLGPTVRVHRGWKLSPRVINALPEATTLHWHGMKLPARADGGPHSLIQPHGTWSPTWEVDQPAATLWYHPHPHGATKDHVYRGVAGLVYVDEPEVSSGLPEIYGVDDVPVILQDVNLTDDGELDHEGIGFGGLDVVGLLGSHILANGIVGAILPVGTERIRLRVLNASNARVYNLAVSDGRPFHLVGTDVGLLPHPIELDHLQLSPGERAGLVVEVRPRERLRLMSEPPDLGANQPIGRLAGGDDRFELLELRAADKLRPSPPVPRTLPGAGPVPNPVAGHPERKFVLGDFLINGQVMDPGRVDAVVPAGTSEIWKVLNDQEIPHNWHIHNAAFEVLSAGGRETATHHVGHKDTVFVAPYTEVVLRVAFGQHSSDRFPYMFHCHLLAHEDAGMMGQFLLVDAATAATLDTGDVPLPLDPPSVDEHGHVH